MMLGLWESKYSLWQPPAPGGLHNADVQHLQTKAKVELLRRENGQESIQVGKHLDAWKRIKKLQQSADLFVSSQLTMAMRYAGKPVPPVVIQAPELLAINAPQEEGTLDVLKTVRSFFGDPSSKEPLEKQIKKKFDDADVDKSGALDQKEMKTLLRNTVNRGAERLSEHDMNNLIEILDADGSGSIEVEELLNAIKPRGSECPYDQEEALTVVADMVDKVLILVDPQHTRYNPWEKHMICTLHASCRSKLVFATMVTAEHQNLFKTPKAILKIAHATAAELGAMTHDKEVSRELRENVLSVGTILDHTKARDGTYVIKGKSKASKDKWRALPNSLSRVVVSCFTHETEHSRSVLRETCDSIKVLNSCLLKGWRYFNKHIEGQSDVTQDEIQAGKNKLAEAAHALARAGGLLKKNSHKVIKELVAIDCTKLLTLAIRLANESNKVSLVVLKAIQMDGATTADKEKLKRDALERRRRVETAVRLGSVVEWTTNEHIDCWADLVLQRNDLDKDPVASSALKNMLRDKKIQRVGQLVNLDRSALTSFLHSYLPESERLKIWREVNRVRASFWGLTIPTPVRSLWLLVREQFLCLEDLRLGYAILRGDVKIPDYWHTSFRDSLVLLTQGLDDAQKPLQLVPVEESLKLPYWDGTRREKTITSWYFSDMQKAGERYRIGKVSAQVVAQFILHIRKDVVETIGWAPTADDADDDE
jgi:Ca2+-binding EF-hand superfamily protein